jgi:hypothetical protein
MPKKTKHSGIVRDNDDPLKRGRLLVECPDLAYGQTLPWAEPKMHFVDSSQNAGSFWIPNVQSIVEVEIEDEEDSEVTTLDPKWICDVYPEGTLPEIFQTNYPQRRGWVTAAGHTLYFDDTDGDLVFRYVHPTGTEIRVDNNGNVLIGNPDSVYATEHMVHGDILDTYLESLRTYLSTLILPVAGSVAGPPQVQPPPIPENLNSSKHTVE